MPDTSDTNLLIETLDETLTLFGTYNYADKGPDEIMNVRLLVNHLCSLPAAQAAEQMADLAQHKHGDILYGTLWSYLIEDNTHPQADELTPLLDNPNGTNVTPTEIPVQSFGDILGQQTS